MPTIQKSIRSPSASRGTPKRASWSASVRASATLERRLGELGHRQRDVGERRACPRRRAREALERQLARDAQRARRATRRRPAAARPAPTIVARSGRPAGSSASSRGIAAAHALHEAAVHRERNVTNRCRACGRRERRAGGLGTHRVARVCARLNRPARRVDAVSVAAVRAGRRSDRHRNALPSGATLSSCLRSRPPVPPASPPAAPDRRAGRPCDRPCAPCCGCCWRRGSCCSWVGSHFTG